MSLLPFEFVSADDPDPRLDQILGAVLATPAMGAARPVVVVLIDGLGWWNLREFLGHAPTLRQLIRRGHEISGAGILPLAADDAATAKSAGTRYGVNTFVGTARSVVPSTTAAAITSLLTGVAPGRHNMLSYELYDPTVDARFNLINFEGYPGRIETFQNQPTWFEILAQDQIRSFALGPKKFIGGGLTLAALRGAAYVASERLEQRAKDAARLSSQGALSYFYVSDVDHAGHAYGVGHAKWLEALELTDRAIGIMLDALPVGVEVVVTADHGMLNTSPTHTLDLAKSPVADLVSGVAGEGRALHLRAAGSPSELRHRLREFLASIRPGTLVLDRSETVEMLRQYNRTGVHRPELLGDVNVFSDSSAQLLDSRFHKPQVFQMVGLHGGLSEAELRVPLLRYFS